MDEAIKQDVKMKEDQSDQATSDASVDASADQDSTTNDTIPYKRFKQINDKNKDLEARLSKYEADQETARQKKLEEDGKLKELLSEKETSIKELQGKADQWDKYKSDRKDMLLSKLPEKDRADFADLKLTQLEKVVNKLTTGSGSGSQPTANENPARGRSDLNMKEMSRSQVRDNWEDILNKHQN